MSDVKRGQLGQGCTFASNAGRRVAAHRIAVISGKGGVGKTTVAVNLSLGLVLRGRSVGLLDADLTGPNVPIMLGLEGECFYAGADGSIEPFVMPIGPDGLKVASMAFLANPDAPIAWKGPMKIGVLRQFVDKISWGELDYMIVDLPPGTGDEPISVFQMLCPDGAIVVTTPDELSLMDAARSVQLARNLDVPVVGIIGNMSGIKCPFCGHEIARSCEEMIRSAAIGLGIPFLGAVDLDPAIASGGDSGRPFILDTVSSAAVLFEEIITRIIGVLEGDGNT